MAPPDGGISSGLRDSAIIRQLLLQRVGMQQARNMQRLLDDVAEELRDRLRGRELTEYQGRRLNKAIAQLQATIDLSPLSDELKAEMTELIGIEAGALSKSVLAVASVETVIPAVSTLTKIANTSLVQGATIGDWFGKLQSGMQFDIERAVKLGVTLGETNPQIARRIFGLGGDAGPEIFPRGRRDAETIARTATNTIGNAGRQAVYDANTDVLNGVVWLSTLDSRTSLVCSARSGLTWSLPDYKPRGHTIPWNGGPPAHFGCRSVSIPAINPDVLDLPAGQRSSAFGPVAADITFDDFLKSQPAAFADDVLGKGRAELWRGGKITLQQLVSNRGNPLTLKQLRERYD